MVTCSVQQDDVLIITINVCASLITVSGLKQNYFVFIYMPLSLFPSSLHFELQQVCTRTIWSMHRFRKGMSLVQISVRGHENCVICRYWPFSDLFWCKLTNCMSQTHGEPCFVSGGSKLADIPMKSCFLPEECAESSVNFGISRIVISIKCCKSNLCNTEHAPGNKHMFISLLLPSILHFL